MMRNTYSDLARDSLLKRFTVVKVVRKRIPSQTRYLVPTQPRMMSETEQPELAEYYTVNNEHGGEIIEEREPIKVYVWQWLAYKVWGKLPKQNGEEKHE